MLIKPAASTPASAPAATLCGNCGGEERPLLHHVRHRGVFRRLCTSCVLRLHPQSFCPTCFSVYPPPPQNDAVLTCFKCYSSSHSQCVGPTPPSPYVCPLCVSPNSPLFSLRPATDDGPGCRVLDGDSARKLLAAAAIASSSMNKAAAAARAEAERRAKEAAAARKRAKDALEYVAHLVTKEKLRRKEAVVERGNVVSSGGGYRNGNAGVLAALNVVELRENERIGGVDRLPVDLDEEMEDGNDDEGVLVRAIEEQLQHEESCRGAETNGNGPHL